MPDFTSLEYLQSGTPVQQRAYHELRQLRIMEILEDYHPLLVGTIPIDLAIDGSDLDIACQAPDLQAFQQKLIELFGNQPQFQVMERYIDEESMVSASAAVWCSFQGPTFPIEIFGQAIPPMQQYAYRHMMIEYRLLRERGESFRQSILHLKRAGIKTEPAFATALGWNEGVDPYQGLLELE
jgi:Domain of unknown function (DUF4269)